MQPFHTIAIPHSDILSGNLTMDVFAADLWEVYRGNAPGEYCDPTLFFAKTYETEGLKNLLAVVKKRLNGKGGDPVIQIQTPFGGGKTHSLIALFHKAGEWGINKAVIVGTALSGEDTLWGILEEQITGKISSFDAMISPGRDAILDFLSENAPMIILMDEVLEYIVKAAGIRVEDSTLAGQTMAFLQELTEAASISNNVVLVLTLPASLMEHFDENAERLYGQLQKISGRVEKIYTPVQDNEITKVIRKRLFSSINSSNADSVVSDFMEYAEGESILPPGIDNSEYYKRFQSSYPFLPDVIDTLYQRWGSFPSFQRTRGVLRLLSLVIFSLCNSQNSYITLADFDLGNQDIRRELLKHVGPEFDAIIASDIIGPEAGAKKCDNSIGTSYQGLSLASRAARTIFMYSHSGGVEKGAMVGEIKRNSTIVGIPSTAVGEIVNKLRDTLFYLEEIEGKYRFTNQPNLNHILITKMENVQLLKIEEKERELLTKSFTKGKFKVYLWPRDNAVVTDDTNLKLIILKERDDVIAKDIIENKGVKPRVYRNTLIFLVPSDVDKNALYENIRKWIAYGLIEEDSTLNLTQTQSKKLKQDKKSIQEGLPGFLRQYYRTVLLPIMKNVNETKKKSQNILSLSEKDLGIPTYGANEKIDSEIYGILVQDGEIVEKIAPLIIKEKYLRNYEYVPTEQLFQSGLKTPGELRIVQKEILERSIKDGVIHGLFGLGELIEGNIVCHYFKKKTPALAFSGNEILIKEEAIPPELIIPPESELETDQIADTGEESETPTIVTAQENSSFEVEVEPELEPTDNAEVGVNKSIDLEFVIPLGKSADIMRIVNYLQTKFKNVKITINATDGEISDQEFEDKIREALRQIGIDSN